MNDFSDFVPATWDRAGLEAAGYEGFVTFSELRQTGASKRPGIYVVVREGGLRPQFLATSAAGKSKDFTEQVPLLTAEWIDGAEVVYIGLAMYGARRDGIHRRLKQYRRTGAGTADNHGGGVWVFQLADVEDLKVCWRSSDDESDAYIAALEHHLIKDFIARPEYGRRPFANRKD